MTPTPINRTKRVDQLREREPNKYKLYKRMLETNKDGLIKYSHDESLVFVDTLNEEQAKELLK